MTDRPRAATTVAIVAMSAVLASLGGCGYSVRGQLPAHIKTVAVPMFVNRTSEPRVESFLTTAIVRAFSTDGRLEVVRPGDADSILEGEVVQYTLAPIAFDPSANVTEYRLSVVLNLRFRDTRERKTLLDQTNVSEYSDFQVTGPVSSTLVLEQAALETAALNIARTIVTSVVERF